MAQNSRYKDTINLPKTSFPMKAELAKREPAILEHWEKEGIYRKLREERKGAKRFILHDGPPYANGNIHMGHALNKVLKDFIVKYKSLKGFDAPYIPGWDCHGLPVEHQLFKELGKRKHEVDQVEFRKKAYGYAERFVGVQRDQFKRLGLFGKWEDPYLTMDPGYEAAIVESFARLLHMGYIYQGTKPIHWCLECETALAEAELEYKDHSSYSITVRCDVQQDTSKWFSGISKNPKILIWTTTPWTLPANLAIAVHPDITYCAFRVESPGGGQEDWIMAQDLVDTNLSALGIGRVKTLGTVKGKDLEGLVYRHPFMERTGKVIPSEHVTLEQGTGCVHIAPGHGQEDHEVGLRYGLEVLSPVNDRGVFTEEAGPFNGMHIFKANPAIIETLKKQGALVQEGKVTHSYPHCWRCRKPVIFRATPQWFIKIDHEDLRVRALKAITDARWVPARGEKRIASMVGSRPDWCLSRQRLWGVPIPAVRCANCGYSLMTKGMVDKFLKEVRVKGTDIWFTEDVSHWVQADVACEKCKSKEMKREHDILDVWFDSGVSHQAVLRQRKDLSYPADLYLEGSDQHRGWFQSALLTAIALEKNAPFRCVLTHGFVTDGEGKKMSKSAGNVIAPSEIVNKYGADVLRLWVSCVDYTDDVRLSDGIVQQVSEAYRKIRNTLRFILGNTSDFNSEKDAVAYGSMTELDRWALRELAILTKECEKAYEAYEFYRVYRLVYQFCILRMSSLYLDILKDRLYTYHFQDPRRRSAQTALAEILKTVTLLISPILPFTAEEVWGLLREKTRTLPVSVHLAMWPELPKEYRSADNGNWVKLLSVREEVLKVLEGLRQQKIIGSALEASVSLYVEKEELRNLLKSYHEELPSIFIVSEVTLVEEKNKSDAYVNSAIIPDLAISVAKTQGAKCERCWVYAPSVGKHATHDMLCEKCVNAVEKVSVE